MAHKTISAFPEADALTDTNVFVVVQEGNSRKVSVAQLKATFGSLLQSALVADVWEGVSEDIFIPPASLAEAMTPTELGYNATITLNLDNGINFEVAHNGNINLANPLNVKPGISGILKFTQDGAGGRTLTFGDAWNHLSGSVPTLNTEGGAANFFAYYVDSNGDLFLSHLNGTVSIPEPEAPSTALGVETVSGTTYTLQPADVGKHKRFTNPGAVTFTIDATHGFSSGERCRFTAAGTGTVTMVASGVTLNSREDALQSAGQFAVWELECVGTNTFDVLGDVA